MILSLINRQSYQDIQRNYQLMRRVAGFRPLCFKFSFISQKGSLTICPTPIGNLKDMSLRIYDSFQGMDILACEDTRRTSQLIRLVQERQLFNFDKELVVKETAEFEDETSLFLKQDKIEYYRQKYEKERQQKWEDFYKKAQQTLDELDSLKDFKSADSIFGIDDDFVNFVLEKIQKTKNEKNRGLLLSFYEHNQDLRIDRLIQCMQYGLKIGLVCDAGTPTLSDPGYKLVDACLKAGIEVKGLPGPSSVTLGLSLCGFPADTFQFEGYLIQIDFYPKSNQREKQGWKMPKNRPKPPLFLKVPSEYQKHFYQLKKYSAPNNRCLLAWNQLNYTKKCFFELDTAFFSNRHVRIFEQFGVKNQRGDHLDHSPLCRRIQH